MTAPAAGPRPAHAAAVDRLTTGYRAIPVGDPVRLAKTSSNLFRARIRSGRPGLDVRGLDGVLGVDPVAGTADVGAMCTYETLVAATLPYGLAPTVVPQLKTITVGGAVTGLGIESSSFRVGLVHESVRELDVLTGAGDVVTATPTNADADLFHGFPNSFGTLGYATRVRLELEPARAFVELRHLRCRSVAALQELTENLVGTGHLDGRPVDYLDGVVFGPDESYLTVGTRTDEPGPVSDYTGQQIYYRSIRRRTHDRLTTADYLWRWDTDWFWCSRAFGAQHPLVRRLWPRRYRRSSVYGALVALDRRWGIADRVEQLHRRPALERVVQDVEIPLERSAAFVDWFLATVPIEPLWWCPLRQRPGEAAAGPPHPRYPLYPLEDGRTYVNVGFWSVVGGDPSSPGATNRRIEHEVSRLGGHKSLYSDSYYPRPEFDARYGGDRYRDLKRRYDPQNRLLDLYAKAVQRR